ncbi:MAG: hypothetical protein WBS33_14760, partial [Verrucomicrobiia bacterium]
APRAAAAAPVTQARPAPVAQRPATAPAISSLDQMLIVIAAAAGLFALVTVIWMMLIPTT